MKKFIYVFNSVVVIIAFLLVSCEDSGTSTISKTTHYLPLKVGNYWIYNTYEIDQNLKIIAGTQAIDSMVIVAEGNFYGRKSYKMVNFRNGSPVDTSYYYSDGLIVYEYFNYSSFFNFDYHKWQVCAGKLEDDFAHLLDTNINNFTFKALKQQVIDTNEFTSNNYIEYSYPTGFSDTNSNNIILRSTFNSKIIFGLDINTINAYKRIEADQIDKVFSDNKGMIFIRTIQGPTSFSYFTGRNSNRNKTVLKLVNLD